MSNRIVSVYITDQELIEYIDELKEDNESVSAFFVDAANFYLEHSEDPEDIDSKIDARIKALLAEKTDLFKDIANESADSEENIIDKINSHYED